MKGENIQHRIFYSAKHSFRFDGEIMFSKEAKVKRIQHHQTSLIRDAKGTSLSRKHKRGKRSTQNKPKQLRKW